MLTENPHAGAFILSLANGNRSFENVVIASGENLQAGTVLGKVTASGKYEQLNTAAEDGTEDAAAILFAATDATDGDAEAAAIARDAEVNGHELVWPSGISGGAKTAAIAQLVALGIIVR